MGNNASIEVLAKSMDDMKTTKKVMDEIRMKLSLGCEVPAEFLSFDPLRLS